MQDVRLALRNLKNRPGFALGAILTLALGIGATTAVFTVLHGVLLAPLPYANPEDVVVLNETNRDFPSLSVTRYNYDDWRARAKSFAGLEAFRSTSMTLAGSGEPERVPAKMLSAGLLPLLGVPIEMGRGFAAADDRPGAEGVALVSAGFAQRRFPDGAVGRPIQLDGRPYTVVGILPARFELFQPADVYVPFGPWAATLPEDRGWHPGIFPVARLAPACAARAGARRDGPHRPAARGRARRLQQGFADPGDARPGSARAERPARAPDAAGRGRPDAAHRLRQRGQPAPGPRGRPAEGAGRARGPRGDPRPHRPPARGREPGARGGGRHRRPAARVVGRVAPDLHRHPGIPARAERRRGLAGRPLRLRPLAGHRRPVRHAARAAGHALRPARDAERGRPRQLGRARPPADAGGARRGRDRRRARPARGRRPAAAQLLRAHARRARVPSRQPADREPPALPAPLRGQHRAHHGGRAARSNVCARCPACAERR